MGLICCAHKWKWCVFLGFFFSFFKTTIWVWPELKINSVSNNFVADLCFGPTSFPIPPSEKRVYIISIKCCHRNANGCQAAARNEFQIFYQAICLCPLLLLLSPTVTVIALGLSSSFSEQSTPLPTRISYM